MLPPHLAVQAPGQPDQGYQAGAKLLSLLRRPSAEQHHLEQQQAVTSPGAPPAGSWQQQYQQQHPELDQQSAQCTQHGMFGQGPYPGPQQPGSIGSAQPLQEGPYGGQQQQHQQQQPLPQQQRHNVPPGFTAPMGAPGSERSSLDRGQQQHWLPPELQPQVAMARQAALAHSEPSSGGRKGPPPGFGPLPGQQQQQQQQVPLPLQQQPEQAVPPPQQQQQQYPPVQQQPYAPEQQQQQPFAPQQQQQQFTPPEQQQAQQYAPLQQQQQQEPVPQPPVQQLPVHEPAQQPGQQQWAVGPPSQTALQGPPPQEQQQQDMQQQQPIQQLFGQPTAQPQPQGPPDQQLGQRFSLPGFDGPLFGSALDPQAAAPTPLLSNTGNLQSLFQQQQQQEQQQRQSTQDRISLFGPSSNGSAGGLNLGGLGMGPWQQQQQSKPVLEGAGVSSLQMMLDAHQQQQEQKRQMQAQQQLQQQHQQMQQQAQLQQAAQQQQQQQPANNLASLLSRMSVQYEQQHRQQQHVQAQAQLQQFEQQLLQQQLLQRQQQQGANGQLPLELLQQLQNQQQLQELLQQQRMAAAGAAAGAAAANAAMSPLQAFAAAQQLHELRQQQLLRQQQEQQQQQIEQHLLVLRQQQQQEQLQQQQQLLLARQQQQQQQQGALSPNNLLAMLQQHPRQQETPPAGAGGQLGAAAFMQQSLLSPGRQPNPAAATAAAPDTVRRPSEGDYASMLQGGATGAAVGNGVSGALRRRPPALPTPAIRCPIARLDDSLVALAGQLAPSQGQRARQLEAWSAVNSMLRQLWPTAQVHLFGSGANELDIGDNNDLDVCLELSEVGDSKEERGEVITRLGEQLEQAGMQEVFAIPRARMPVVKFVHSETGFKVDITVNNRLAVINTKLLRDYAAVDARLRPLVLLVKHWAKRRRVNDAYVGTLSSYAYVLMCISHLQSREPPVLPVLQEMPPTHRHTVGQWSCDYCDDMSRLSGFGAANTESLAELLVSFFCYWARHHDYRQAVVSIRVGGGLTKADKGWTTRVGTERHLLCIEDPFELSHDLGRTVHADGCDKLRREFRRAWDVCRNSGDELQLLEQLFLEVVEQPQQLLM